MPYIRHRDRMVTQSVFQDLRNTLIACRWMPGTTSKPVQNPATPRTFDPVTGQYSTPAPQVITTSPEQILPLLDKIPVSLIDYFPESEGDRGRNERTPKNTLALDSGQASDAIPAEMGSARMEQEYVFNMAFYASSDAVAIALLNDLRDRYNGRIVAGDGIDLYDWVGSPDDVAVRMEVDSFRYAQNQDPELAPYEVHLYFAELALTDFVDP